MQNIFILWCYNCDGYVVVDENEFKKYSNDKFICNRCLDIKIPQEYCIDNDIHSGIYDRRNEIVDKKNKKRRKGDN